VDRGRVNLGRRIGQLIRQLPTRRFVAEVIGHLVGGDPIEPARKGPTAVPVAGNAPKCVDEDLGRYVLGCSGVTKACTDVAIDPINVAVIEKPEGVCVRLRSLDEKALILVHAASLWLNQGDVITEFTDCEEG